MKMFFDHKITPYGGLRILEATSISPLPLCLSGGNQNSLGDALRHIIRKLRAKGGQKFAKNKYVHFSILCIFRNASDQFKLCHCQWK